MTGIDDPGAGAARRFREEAHRERPGLAALCLLAAAALAPQTAPQAPAAEAELDRLAEETARCALGRGPGAAGGPQRWVWALRTVLGQRHDFRGRPADYGRLESSLLPAVLRRRRGLPILLSVVWTEVGRRAGAPVHGVAGPGHFLTGVGEPHGLRVVVDPFAGGPVLSAAEAARLPGAAGVLPTVARVLANVRAWADDRPEQSGTALTALDLALMLPRHPARLRLERARLLVRRGDFQRGAAELDSCAGVVAPVDEGAAALLRREARAARALLN